MATARKSASPNPTSRAPSVGASIDQLWALRESKRELEAKIKVLDDAIKADEEALMDRLEKEGLEKATGTKAGVSISKNVVANVEDWDKFWGFISKTKNYQLVQRRVSDPAYRELMEMGTKIPGVLPFTKTRLNVRSL